MSDTTTQTRDERPVSEIVSNLWLNTETLIRQEFQLGLADAEARAHAFKSELDADVDKLKRELTIKAIGGAVAFIALLSLTAALILGLAEAMPPWASALCVGLVAAAIGGLLLMRAVRVPAPPNPSELLPKQAAQSAKEDVRTIQEAMK